VSAILQVTQLPTSEELTQPGTGLFGLADSVWPIRSGHFGLADPVWPFRSRDFSVLVVLVSRHFG